MKSAIMLFFLCCLLSPVFSNGQIEISCYDHQGPTSKIIELRMINNMMENTYKTEIINPEKMNKIIEIDKEYYEGIFARIKNLNYQKIIENINEYNGMDGYIVYIRIGNESSVITLGIWCPYSDEETRGLIEFNEIVKDIFIKFGVLDRYRSMLAG